MDSPRCRKDITALELLPLLERSPHVKRNYVDLLIETLMLPFLGYGIKPDVTMLYLALVVLSQVILLPIYQIQTYAKNQKLQYKRIKSIVGFWGILLGYGLGLGVGFVLLNQAFSWNFVRHFLSLFHVNLSVTMILGLLAVKVKLLGQARLDYVLGAGLGLLLGQTIGMASEALCVVDLMMLAACGVTFVLSLVLKALMRAAYKKIYGHSNTDGYLFVLGEPKVLPVDKEQAKIFNVSPQAISQLRCSLFQLIQACRPQPIPPILRQKPIHLGAKRLLKSMYYLLLTANVVSARYCRKLLMVNARLFHTYRQVRAHVSQPYPLLTVQENQLLGQVSNDYFKILVNELLAKRALQTRLKPQEVNTVFHQAARKTRQVFLKKLPETVQTLALSMIEFADFSQLYQFLMIELIADLGYHRIKMDGGGDLIASHVLAVEQFDVLTQGEVMP